jgi:hypothetical protein
MQAKKKPKTPSQRLRAVLWLLWEQNTGNLEPDLFEEWYNIQMEKVIQAVKNKLR